MTRYTYSAFLPMKCVESDVMWQRNQCVCRPKVSFSEVFCSLAILTIWVLWKLILCRPLTHVSSLSHSKAFFASSFWLLVVAKSSVYLNVHVHTCSLIHSGSFVYTKLSDAMSLKLIGCLWFSSGEKDSLYMNHLVQEEIPTLSAH